MSKLTDKKIETVFPSSQSKNHERQNPNRKNFK